MSTHAIRAFASAAVLAATLLLDVSLACAADWQWTITPYVWASNLGVKVATDTRTIVDRNAAFTDLLKNLDMTAQVHVEAQHGRNGILVDFFGNRLSKDSQIVLPQIGGAPAALSSSIAVALLDAGGLFNPTGTGQGVTLIYGSRMLIQRAKLDARITPPHAAPFDEDQDLNETKVDALVGARYSLPLSRRLTARAHADVSTGATRYTWSGSAGIAYALSRSGRCTLTAGYRRMEVKLAGPKAMDTNLKLSGIASGLSVRF